MNKRTLILIVIAVIVIVGGIIAFLTYSDNNGHWCSPGTHWGLGYNAQGLSDSEIEASSKCLDNASIY